MSKHVAVKAPFHSDGSLSNDGYGYGDTLEYRFFEFEILELRNPELRRHSHSAYFVWTETGGRRQFPMFLTDMEHLIKNTEMAHGRVSGQFSVQKRGTHYGIRLEVVV